MKLYLAENLEEDKNTSHWQHKETDWIQSDVYRQQELNRMAQFHQGNYSRSEIIFKLKNKMKKKRKEKENTLV